MARRPGARAGEHGWRLRLYEEVGKSMYAKRKELGMTLAQMGLKVGCAGNTLARIENGEQPCPLHILVAFREATGASLDDLVPKVLVAAARRPEPEKQGFWGTLGTDPVR